MTRIGKRIGMAAALAATAMAGAGAAQADSGTIALRAQATFSDGTSADRLYRIDGADGSETWLRVRCDSSVAAGKAVGGKASPMLWTHTVKSPRDAASGLATGKRMHKPFTIIKEWGAKMAADGSVDVGAGSDAAVGQKASWNLKENVKRTGGWNVKENVKRESKPQYDVKKVEGTGARANPMAVDDWHEASFAEGAPDLCA